MLKYLSDRLGFCDRPSSVQKMCDKSKEESTTTDQGHDTSDSSLQKWKRSTTSVPPRRNAGPDGKKQKDFS